MDWPALEDKGLTASLHYRDVDDEAQLGPSRPSPNGRGPQGFARDSGARSSSSSRPSTPTRAPWSEPLLRESGASRALYAGDDTTDLDAFRALDGLELAVRIAVASPEGPRAPPGRGGPIVLHSPSELLPVLERL